MTHKASPPNGALGDVQASAASIAVAGGMVLNKGLLLLGRRAAHRRICPNKWDLIGGHLEAGETPEQALVREFREEIDAAPIRYRLLTILDFSPEAGTPLRYALFRVDALDGPPRLADAEHTELRWFDLREAAVLPDLASGRYRTIFVSQALEMGR